MDKVTLAELDKVKNEKDVVVLDVRTEEEFEKNHLEGSVNIPNGSLNAKLEELDKDKDYYVVCGSGMRSMTATTILKANDFKAHDVEAVEELAKKD